MFFLLPIIDKYSYQSSHKNGPIIVMTVRHCTNYMTYKNGHVHLFFNYS